MPHAAAEPGDHEAAPRHALAAHIDASLVLVAVLVAARKKVLGKVGHAGPGRERLFQIAGEPVGLAQAGDAGVPPETARIADVLGEAGVGEPDRPRARRGPFAEEDVDLHAAVADPGPAVRDHAGSLTNAVAASRGTERPGLPHPRLRQRVPARLGPVVGLRAEQRHDPRTVARPEHRFEVARRLPRS